MPVWRTQKLVQWYCLPEDMHCEVPADGPLFSLDRACIDIKDDKLSNKRATHINDDCRPREAIAETVYLANQERAPSPPLVTTPQIANQQYVSQPHDSWPFLSCQTDCLALRIQAVHVSFPTSARRAKQRRPHGWPSIFELPQFAKRPTIVDTCDLICLETQEGVKAGTLRHMETSKLKLGDTVELIAVSTGAVSSIGVEGDEEDKLYRLVMYAHVGSGPVNAQTSEYLG